MSGISRRSILAGIGGASGAVLLGARTGAAFALASDDGTGLPTSTSYAAGAEQGPAGYALPAVNPAWTYVTLGYHHFVATIGDPTPGTSVSGTAGMQTTGSGTFHVPLMLPQGSVIREAAFEVYNASPSTGLSVGLTRLALSSTFVGGAFAFTTANAGKHTVSIGSLSSFGAVDNVTNAYGVSAYLQSGAFGLFGARVAWEAPGASYFPVPATRVYDSRKAGAGGPIAGETSRVVSVKDGIDVNAPNVVVTTTDLVPAGARAVVFNVTAAAASGTGFLAVAPGTATAVTASTINWSGVGLTLANGGTTPIDASRQVKLFAGGPGASTHVIIDVTGYFR